MFLYILIQRIMLNIEEMEELKIEGLMQQEGKQKQSPSLFVNMNDFYSFSNNVKKMGSGSNANIRSFIYILLHSIFYVQNSQGKAGKPEEDTESILRLTRLKKLLLDEKLNMAEVQNIPIEIRKLLKVATHNNENSELQNEQDDKKCNEYNNKFLKKIILEFLNFAKKELHSEQSLTAVFKIFPLCEIALCLYIRAVLFKQYEIKQALNYDSDISDHTLYTALCDAFVFTGLRLQDTESYIGKNYLIVWFPGENEEKVYLLGFKNSEQNKYSSSENDFHTFRGRKSQKKQEQLRFQFQKILNHNQTSDFTKSCQLQKPKKQKEAKNIEKKQEYSNFDILQYLTPEVRQSMLKSPRFFKNKSSK